MTAITNTTLEPRTTTRCDFMKAASAALAGIGAFAELQARLSADPAFPFRRGHGRGDLSLRPHERVGCDWSV